MHRNIEVVVVVEAVVLEVMEEMALVMEIAHHLEELHVGEEEVDMEEMEEMLVLIYILEAVVEEDMEVMVDMEEPEMVEVAEVEVDMALELMEEIQVVEAVDILVKEELGMEEVAVMGQEAECIMLLVLVVAVVTKEIISMADLVFA